MGGGATTVTAPTPNPPAPSRTSAPPVPASSAPVDTVPAGCGGPGWGQIGSVGSGRKLGLPSSDATEGSAVVSGGYAGLGWFRVTGQSTSEFHPCNASNPGMALAWSQSAAQLSNAVNAIRDWSVESAGTAGAVYLHNFLGQGCLTDNGAGRQVTLEECAPGNKLQQWRIP
ncbi:hypothetical protein ACFQ0T_37090 [Kitasatospora gansuensis]